MSEPIKSSQGSLFIQTSPLEAPEYFACADLGDVTEPAGDQTLINCRNADGNVVAIGSTQAPPDAVTTTVTALVYPESDVLDRIKNCFVTLYAMTRSCGKAGVFSNYVRGYILHHARVTSRGLTNLVMRETDEPSNRTLDISAWNPIYQIREIAAVRQTIAETRNLNDIVFDMDAQCAGDCGAAKDKDDVGFAVGSGSAGSPTSDADVWQTEDKGSTWANVTGLVPSPFSGGDIKSAVRFQVDKNTWRLLVASGQKAGSAQVAYSDDDGSTWTTVTVGATAWEGAAGADALFAFDREHIWFATDHGRVYFSDDGGATWTSQTSALTASLAHSLNGVKFSDYDNGYAVGDTDTIIKTNDGGENWSALTAPTSSDNVTALAVLSKYTLLVGSNADGLWKSVDGGVTWTAVTFTGQGTTGTVKGLDFVNELIGFMVHNTSAPLGSIHRTLNGGVTWEKITTPANAGLNAVTAIDENTAFACGNAYGGTGVVIRVAG